VLVAARLNHVDEPGPKIECMYDHAAPVEALESARAALRLAERRVGVRSQEEFVAPTPAADQPLATALLPGGVLPRGGVVSVLDSACLTT
jgi:hypothetical protein